jgi:hypothetical protein
MPSATITGPQADLNLGITTYVTGAPMNPIQLDTSAVATDTISYVATDSAGMTSTSTRTVIIEAAPSNRPDGRRLVDRHIKRAMISRQR